MTPTDSCDATARARRAQIEVPALEAVHGFLHSQLVTPVTLRNFHLRRAWADPVQGLRLLYQGWFDDDSEAFLCAGETLDPPSGLKEAERLNRQFQPAESERSRRWRHAAAYSRDLSLLFTVFPVDRHLSSLTRTTDARLMQQVLETRLDRAASQRGLNRLAVNPVQYKPGRKALLEYRLDWDAHAEREELPASIYARVSRHARRGYTNLRTLRVASPEHAFRLPKPVALFEDLELELMGHLSGRPLSRLCHDQDFPLYCSAVGEGLAEFHRAPVVLERRANGALDPAGIEQCAARLAEELPEYGSSVRSVAPAVSRRLSGTCGPPSLVHGDFHPGNILVDESRLGLLDFEACGMGRPGSDVGFFCAELTLLALKKFGDAGALDAGRHAFLEAYVRAASGARLGDLDAYAAAACLWCADFQCLRRPEQAGWRERAQAMVDAAHRLAQDDLNI